MYEGREEGQYTPIQQGMRLHGGSKGNTITLTKLADRTSPNCDRTLDHNTQTSVTDELDTVDTSTEGSVYDITKTRSGWTVHRPIKPQLGYIKNNKVTKPTIH